MVQDNFLYGFKNMQLRRLVSLHFLEGLKFASVDHGNNHCFGIEVISRPSSPYLVFYADSKETQSSWLNVFIKAASQIPFEVGFIPFSHFHCTIMLGSLRIGPSDRLRSLFESLQMYKSVNRGIIRGQNHGPYRFSS